VADEHMVEQMSRSRSNRGGRRSFRSTTPPPSPKPEISTNQKTDITDERNNAVFKPVTENSLVVEELLSSEDQSILTNSHNVENKETNTPHKRPPSPNLPVPIATKKSLNDNNDVVITDVNFEDESKLVNSKPFGKPSGVTTGQPQHTQVPVRTSAMPPPLLNKLESSASKVLTEEFQKQLGQENSKLRSLIIKEVRRPGKSKFVHYVCNKTTFKPVDVLSVVLYASMIYIRSSCKSLLKLRTCNHNVFTIQSIGY